MMDTCCGQRHCSLRGSAFTEATPRAVLFSPSQAKQTAQKHLSEGFDGLFAHLKEDGEGDAGDGVTNEHMRRCFFGDFMDTEAEEPAQRKWVLHHAGTAQGQKGCLVSLLLDTCTTPLHPVY
jgi:hypothetical protein